MSEQDSATQPSEPQAGAASEPSTPSVDVQAILAQNEALVSEVRKVRDEAAKRRVEKNEATERARLEAEANQQHAVAYGEAKKQLEAQKARIAELEALAPKAERYTAWEQRQAEAVKAKAAALPEHFKRLLDGQASIEGKLDVIAAYDATVSQQAGRTPEHPAPSHGAPAAPEGSIDWSSLRGEALSQAIKTHGQDLLAASQAPARTTLYQRAQAALKSKG